MPTEKKIEAVKELTDRLSRSTVVIGAEYRGLRVSEMTTLRRQLRDAGVEMHVVKNTIFRLALEAAGKPELGGLAEGPTALVIGFDNPLVPVKVVVEYQRTARNTFAARSAFFAGQIVPANQLPEIATLPPREVLIAQVAGALQSPVVNFLYLMRATVQQFAGLIESRANQLEGVS